MQISRRGALLGATAAAVVTGATVVPVAIKAAGVKAVMSIDQMGFAQIMRDLERLAGEG